MNKDSLLTGICVLIKDTEKPLLTLKDLGAFLIELSKDMTYKEISNKLELKGIYWKEDKICRIIKACNHGYASVTSMRTAQEGDNIPRLIAELKGKLIRSGVIVLNRIQKENVKILILRLKELLK